MKCRATDSQPIVFYAAGGGNERLRAPGVTTEHRSNVFPDLPAVAESWPRLDAGVYYGITAPRRGSTPAYGSAFKAS